MGLTDYIILTPNPNLVRSSISTIVQCIIKCNRYYSVYRIYRLFSTNTERPQRKSDHSQNRKCGQQVSDITGEDGDIINHRAELDGDKCGLLYLHCNQ